MTAARADAAEPRARRPAAKKAAKAPAKKGAAPAKKVAKRPATGAKRGKAGAKAPPAVAKSADLGRDGDTLILKALVRQAARVADRLETIDQLLSGNAAAWCTVGIPRTDAKRGRVMVEVRVDDLVREERSQTTVLRGLLAEIHRQRSGLPGGPPPEDEDDDLDV